MIIDENRSAQLETAFDVAACSGEGRTLFREFVSLHWGMSGTSIRMGNLYGREHLAFISNFIRRRTHCVIKSGENERCGRDRNEALMNVSVTQLASPFKLPSQLYLKLLKNKVIFIAVQPLKLMNGRLSSRI